MMIVPAVFYATRGLPQRTRDAQRLEAASGRLWSDNCLVDIGRSGVPLKAPCVPPGQGRAVALTGDSHAAMLADTLRPIAERAGYRLIEFAMAGCPPMIGVTASSVSMGPRFARDCLQFQDGVRRYIENDKNIQVVVLAGYWGTTIHDRDLTGYVDGSEIDKSVDRAQSWALAKAGLNRLINELEKSGKVVYLLKDTPTYAFDPFDTLLTQQMWIRYQVARWTGSPILRYPQGIAPEMDSQEGVTLVSAVAAAHPKTRVFDMHRAFCTSSGCRFANGSQALYIDDQHLSPLGAQIALAGFHLP